MTPHAQVHHSEILSYYEAKGAYEHYAFFRARLGHMQGPQAAAAGATVFAAVGLDSTAAVSAPSATVAAASLGRASPPPDAPAAAIAVPAATGKPFVDLDELLERMLQFLVEASGVPVLLSMMVLVFAGGDSDLDLEQLPSNRLQLYSVATEIALRRRLTSRARKALCLSLTHALAFSSAHSLAFFLFAPAAPLTIIRTATVAPLPQQPSFHKVPPRPPPDPPPLYLLLRSTEASATPALDLELGEEDAPSAAEPAVGHQPLAAAPAPVEQSSKTPRTAAAFQRVGRPRGATRGSAEAAPWRHGSKSSAGLEMGGDGDASGGKGPAKQALSSEEVYDAYAIAARVLDAIQKGGKLRAKLHALVPKGQWVLPSFDPRRFPPRSLASLMPPVDPRLRKLCVYPSCLSKLRPNVAGLVEGALKPKASQHTVGLDMLRRVAVANQLEGRREFSARHVRRSRLSVPPPGRQAGGHEPGRCSAALSTPHACASSASSRSSVPSTATARR